LNSGGNNNNPNNKKTRIIYLKQAGAELYQAQAQLG
jgi:hypothetical protein